MTETITIRDAQPADGSALTTMVRTSAAYAGEYQVMVAPQLIDATYMAVNPTRVGIDEDGAIVGFASLLLPGRGEPGEAELDFMFVANDRQRGGIGRLLFDDAVALCQRLGVRTMHIVSHPPSEKVYLRVGAVRVGEIPPTGRITWSRPLLRFDLT